MEKIPFSLGLGTIFLNAVCIIFGILYFASIRNHLLWNIVGIVILFTILCNYGILLFYGKNYNSRLKYVRKFRIHSYIYYFLSSLAYFLMFFGNFIGYNQEIGSNILIGLMINLSYFLLFLYPLLLLTYFIKHSKKEERPSESPVEKKRLELGLKVVIVLVNLGGLFFALIVDFVMLLEGWRGMLVFALGIFGSMMGIFFGLGALGSTFTLLHMVKKGAKGFLVKILTISILGVGISSICFLPLFTTPAFIQQADEDFSMAFNPYFGGDWRTSINALETENYFMDTPFQLTGYFLGINNPSCVLLSDILFFDGSESSYFVDKNTLLYFDAYLPPNNGQDLPGENSTIIRIHGGGWTIGDKGLGNMRMMNRYLAAQGYCVFDIQYGLNNVTNNFGGIYIPSKEVLGNFTIDDMMRHIGNFTYYLETHIDDFGANLDSVFVSGGSAGGQLTCATALSIASNNYTDTFSDQMTMKGLIPFYPANNVSYDFALASKNEWADPDQLVAADSPPCLIFQGEKDGLILKSLRFQESYAAFGRTDCAVLTFPYAGHATDLYFPGYYNQVFLYYMERFLYLYH